MFRYRFLSSRVALSFNALASTYQQVGYKLRTSGIAPPPQHRHSKSIHPVPGLPTRSISGRARHSPGTYRQRYANRHSPSVVFKSKSSSLYFCRKATPPSVLFVSDAGVVDSERGLLFSGRIRLRDRAGTPAEFLGEVIATGGVPSKTSVLSSDQRLDTLVNPTANSVLLVECVKRISRAQSVANTLVFRRRRESTTNSPLSKAHYSASVKRCQLRYKYDQ